MISISWISKPARVNEDEESMQPAANTVYMYSSTWSGRFQRDRAIIHVALPLPMLLCWCYFPLDAAAAAFVVLVVSCVHSCYTSYFTGKWSSDCGKADAVFSQFLHVIYLIHFFRLAPLFVTQIQGQTKQFPHTKQVLVPPPHCSSCLAFLSQETFSSFLPRRLASNCAYPR